MLRRILGLAMVSALALTGIACEPKLPPSSKTNGNGAASVDAPTLALDQIGGDLYPPTPAPARPAPVGTAGAVDPIIVRQCQITLSRTENLPSKNEGKLVEFCTEIAPGVIVPQKDVVAHPRTKKQYQRLKVGDHVKVGQLIAILDDAVPSANYDIADAALTAADAKQVASKEILNAATAEYEMNVKLYRQNTTPESEVRRTKAQMERSKADLAEADGSKLKSSEERKKAKIILEEHEIHSDIAGEIKRFYRHSGESIKALDPIAEIQDLNEMRVEGMVDVQYLALGAKIRQGQTKVNALIERPEHTAHERVLEGHLLPVRAVAVCRDPRLIVSASDDKTVRVWERTTNLQRGIWRHDVPVRAVACTTKGADSNFCLSGADDGVARLWDLDQLAATKPTREMKGRHQQQIICAAFAPNGRAAATSDAREVILWDVTSGDMLYRISNPHKGPITNIQFTPQCRLITEGRDNTVRVWKLGDKGAALETTMEFRSGDVGVLGVSPDGQRILFDKERLLHLVDVSDQRTEGVLHAPSETSQFSTFAMFSPDGRLILTAGTGDYPLQLWRAPMPGIRESMIRRLAVAPGSLPTCAAFSPDGTFAVTGTQDSKILVWGMPDEQEIKRQLTATVTYVDPSIDSADRKVRIWADVNDTQGVRLLAGETVNLIVLPPSGR